MSILNNEKLYIGSLSIFVLFLPAQCNQSYVIQRFCAKKRNMLVIFVFIETTFNRSVISHLIILKYAI